MARNAKKGIIFMVALLPDEDEAEPVFTLDFPTQQAAQSFFDIAKEGYFDGTIEIGKLDLDTDEYEEILNAEMQSLEEAENDGDYDDSEDESESEEDEPERLNVRDQRKILRRIG